jgi:MYXO-CTERM domain-containing protein
MFRSRLCVSGVVVAALAASSSSALAGWFEYSTSVSFGSMSGVTSVDPTNDPRPGTALTTPNGSILTFIPNSRSTVANHLSGAGSNANFGSFHAVPSAAASDFVDITFTFTVTISDYASKTSTALLGTGTATFFGRLVGPIGDSGTGVVFQDLGQSPLVPGNPAQALVLVSGGDNYIGAPYTPSPPGDLGGGQTSDGVMGAMFSTTTVPAPASLGLLGLGGLVTLRRRR